MDCFDWLVNLQLLTWIISHPAEKISGDIILSLGEIKCGFKSKLPCCKPNKFNSSTTGTDEIDFMKFQMKPPPTPQKRIYFQLQTF